MIRKLIVFLTDRFRQKPKIIDTITNAWSIQVRKQLTKSYGKLSFLLNVKTNNIMVSKRILNALKFI